MPTATGPCGREGGMEGRKRGGEQRGDGGWLGPGCGICRAGVAALAAAAAVRPHSPSRPPLCCRRTPCRRSGAAAPSSCPSCSSPLRRRCCLARGRPRLQRRPRQRSTGAASYPARGKLASDATVTSDKKADSHVPSPTTHKKLTVSMKSVSGRYVLHLRLSAASQRPSNSHAASPRRSQRTESITRRLAPPGRRN